MPNVLGGPVHAHGTTTYTMSLFYYGYPNVVPVDLTYSVTSGNGAITGPATVLAYDNEWVTFNVAVTPTPGLPNGTVITGSITGTTPLYVDSSSVELTVVPPREVLHQWSFTTDGRDSVGGADAVLYNISTPVAGALVLDGVDDYAELPIAATLSSLTYVSVEMWVTWTGSSSWERFFDFGTGTEVNWFMTPRASQTTNPRVAITTGGNPAEQRIDAPSPFPGSTRTHVVFTLDGAGASEQFKLYMNGDRVATHSEASALDPAELGPLTNIWLGRSQYPADPYLDAAIDELVIHGTVLTDFEVDQRHRGEIFADTFEWGTTGRWSLAVP
ncbi:MAG TPA: LamG domain-containing protein [Methylomirabilota bacterium]|nr:LamG domain-containing protein [Methylomirabilota bacterium]